MTWRRRPSSNGAVAQVVLVSRKRASNSSLPSAAPSLPTAREPPAESSSPPADDFVASFLEGRSDRVIPADLCDGRLAELIPEERDDEPVRSLRQRLSSHAGPR